MLPVSDQEPVSSELSQSIQPEVLKSFRLEYVEWADIIISKGLITSLQSPDQVDAVGEERMHDDPLPAHAQSPGSIEACLCQSGSPQLNINTNTAMTGSSPAPSPESEKPFSGFDHLCSQATKLMMIFESQGKISDIDDAIACWYYILGKLEEFDPYKPGVLDRLGRCYLNKFEYLGDPSDIDKSIAFYTKAMSQVSADDMGRLRLVINLAKAYEERFIRLGNLSDISTSIAYLNEVISLAPENHMSKILGMRSLGNSLQARFQHLGNMNDINQAIAYKTQAISFTSEDDPNRPGWLTSLGTSHRLLFQRQGDVGQIEKAITYQTEALSLLRPGHERESYLMTNLGISYHCRFERLGKIEDIEQAIHLHSRSVSLTAEGHSERSARLNNLGASHQSRFEALGDIHDSDQAIRFLDQGVSLTPNEHAQLSSQLTNLGNAHLRRFLWTDDENNINQAIHYHTRTVSATPDDHADKPGHLSHLGNSYRVRFQRLGDLKDADQAIHFQTRAVANTPDGHVDKPKWLSNLGLSHADLFRRLGNVDSIDNAITYQVRALSLVPEDHSGRPGWLGNLGIAYQTRFSRLGDVSDIDRAIDFHTKAVSLAPESSIDKARWLANLSTSLLSRFHSLENAKDINQAIVHQALALTLVSEAHPSRPGLLDSLGLSLQHRFQYLGDAEDIDRAIDCHTQANLLAPENHVARPSWLINLGDAYQRRFERLEDITDINNAVSYHTQAVLHTSEDHADRPGRLKRLGLSHYHRFQRLKEQLDYDSAIQAFQESAHSSLGSASVRFHAACQWARALCQVNLESSLPAYQRAMELLPQVVWLGNTFQHRYQDILSLKGALSEAVTAASICGYYDNAVEWLEEGHAIVWKQVLNLRTTFDDLRTASPKLASRLEQVAWELDQAGQVQPNAGQLDLLEYHLEQKSQQHRTLAQEWEHLIEDARNIPGFESLFRPKTITQLAEAAKSGPVVTINVQTTRCDAFILMPGCQPASAVHLPNLSYDKAALAHGQLMDLLNGNHTRDGSKRKPIYDEIEEGDGFTSILRFLWLDIVRPILDHLQYLPQSDLDKLPHVTWCTSGPLSFLPLHAAGLYSADEAEACLFKHVISSYAPTITSLLASPKPPSEFKGLLAIGQFDTPGQSILHGTTSELEQISRQFHNLPLTQLTGESATASAVLAEMENHSWVHLACHASQHVIPGMSAFYLHDRPLNLSTIISKPLRYASFAFLSACETASGDQRLPNEAVHLAAGMLVAGYQSVIATMWSIKDNEAPLVTKQVYGHMLQDGKADSSKAAKALHLAVQCLRDQIGENRFEVWVPYIHIGL